MKLRTPALLSKRIAGVRSFTFCLATTLGPTCELIDAKLALRRFVADQVALWLLQSDWQDNARFDQIHYKRQIDVHRPGDSLLRGAG